MANQKVTILKKINGVEISNDNKKSLVEFKKKLNLPEFVDTYVLPVFLTYYNADIDTDIVIRKEKKSVIILERLVTYMPTTQAVIEETDKEYIITPIRDIYSRKTVFTDTIKSVPDLGHHLKYMLETLW